ncbi:hypothetical protein MNL01_06850 [Bartonella krasnovii]|nr:hypothetical protein [Bartonella krasnovii]UNF53353.1 hypothetical protein MNL01_06850 [Bartonella krasnovii]
MERFGTVWNGLERFGTVWNGLERFGTVWNGLEQKTLKTFNNQEALS